MFSKKQVSLGPSIAGLLSVACLVHCALLPIAMILLPIGVSTFLQKHEWLEGVLIMLSLVAGIYATVHSYVRHHKKVLPLLLIIVAACLLIYHVFVEKQENKITSSMGVVLILIAQTLNYIFCKKSSQCHTHRH